MCQEFDSVGIELAPMVDLKTLSPVYSWQPCEPGKAAPAPWCERVAGTQAASKPVLSLQRVPGVKPIQSRRRICVKPRKNLFYGQYDHDYKRLHVGVFPFYARNGSLGPGEARRRERRYLSARSRHVCRAARVDGGPKSQRRSTAMGVRPRRVVRISHPVQGHIRPHPHQEILSRL